MNITVMREFDEVKPFLNSSRVIAVTSGKGGVGKTNIAVNLAIAIAGMGMRVVVFDADLGMSNAEVLLGVAPKYTVYDFLYKQKSLREILTLAPGNIGIISGGSGLVEMANLDSESIKYLRDVVQDLEMEVDVVLVETGAGLNKNVLAFTAAAQEVIIVATPDPTSIVDAYGIIKVLSKYGVHKEFSMIVNRFIDFNEAELTFKKLDITVRRFLQGVRVSCLGFIPEDNSVVQSVKLQVPFVIENNSSAASKAIRSIANQLIYQIIRDKDLAKKESAYNGIGGFLKKLTNFFNSNT